jgi:hypothetical protein
LPEAGCYFHKETKIQLPRNSNPPR